MFLFRRESRKRPEGTVSINETAEMRSVQCSCKPRLLYPIIKKNIRNILLNNYAIIFNTKYLTKRMSNE